MLLDGLLLRASRSDTPFGITTQARACSFRLKKYFSLALLLHAVLFFSKLGGEAPTKFVLKAMQTVQKVQDHTRLGGGKEKIPNRGEYKSRRKSYKVQEKEHAELKT
jgi:hypothetical protein